MEEIKGTEIVEDVVASETAETSTQNDEKNERTDIFQWANLTDGVKNELDV